MIDTPSAIEQRLAAIEQHLAELERFAAHPALMKIIGDYEQQAAALRMLTEQATKRQAAMVRPVWTPDSETPPPETVRREDLIDDDVWNDQIASTEWAHGWTARDVIERSEDGSPLVELCRRVLLAYWRLRWAEMEMVRARTAGHPPTADQHLAVAAAKTEAAHVGAELGDMMSDVGNALALAERWETMADHERVLYSAYRRQADVIISEKAMAPLPDIPKKRWFR